MNIGFDLILDGNFFRSSKLPYKSNLRINEFFRKIRISLFTTVIFLNSKPFFF